MDVVLDLSPDNPSKLLGWPRLLPHFLCITYTPGFFLSTLFKFYTHAVQNPEFCNKNIKIEINWIIKLSQKYLFRFYIYIHYLWKSKYGTLRYYLSVYSHLMWTMQSIFLWRRRIACFKCAMPDDECCPCLCANIFSRRPGYLKHL